MHSDKNNVHNLRYVSRQSGDMKDQSAFFKNHAGLFVKRIGSHVGDIWILNLKNRGGVGADYALLVIHFNSKAAAGKYLRP